MQKRIDRLCPAQGQQISVHRWMVSILTDAQLPAANTRSDYVCMCVVGVFVCVYWGWGIQHP